MPRFLATLAQLLPSTAGVQGLVKINQMSAELADVRPELLQLLCLGLIYAVLAWWRWVRRGQHLLIA